MHPFKASRKVLPGVVVVASMAATSCGAGASRMKGDHLQAQLLMEKNFGIIRQAVSGKPFDIQELTQALDFMSSTTGIVSRDEGTFVGRIPNSHLPEDLGKWEKWYSSNKQKIFIDPQGKIQVER